MRPEYFIISAGHTSNVAIHRWFDESKVQLSSKLVVCPVKPVPLTRSPMDTERSSDGVAKFVRPELILPRKNFDSFRQPGAAFDRNLQAKGEIVDVYPALLCQHWLLGKDPKVTAAPGLLERRFNAILAKFPLQFEQIFESILVVGVDGDPLRPLCLRVQCINANRDSSAEVFPDGLN